MKWLVTAFEPFGGATTNSSLIVAEALRSRFSQVLVHAPLPVGFDSAWGSLKETLVQHPNVEGVLALGEAGGRTRIGLERVALNWNDARIADNNHFVPLNLRFLRTALICIGQIFLGKNLNYRL